MRREHNKMFASNNIALFSNRLSLLNIPLFPGGGNAIVLYTKQSTGLLHTNPFFHCTTPFPTVHLQNRTTENRGVILPHSLTSSTQRIKDDRTFTRRLLQIHFDQIMLSISLQTKDRKEIPYKYFL